MDGSSIIDQLADAPLSDLEEFLAAIQARLEAEELEIQLEDAQRNAEAIRAECGSFKAFVKRAWKIIEPGTPLRWNWHLDAMCDHLEAISRGTLFPRLIINVPPGSSKSTIVTVLWQAWEWGPLGRPHRKFLTSSFDGDNVVRDTRKTRDLIQSEWYRTLWPEVFDARGKLKRSGETSFANRHTGTREGVAFYSIMGKRGDVVIIDDPHSLLDAESDTQRKKATRTFIEGGLSRVNDEQTSAMVIVMQRLHADDLTGALLAHDVGFIHLMIPMEFEESRRCTTPLKVTDPATGEKKDWTDPRSYEGELLDPDRFPRAVVEQKKKSPYSYAGQYLQRPAPREGGLFKVDKIRVVEYPEPGGKLVRGWDLAASIEEGAAYTVGVLMRLLPDGQIYIEDVVRFRGTPFEVDRTINKTARADGLHVKQSLPQDPGAAGKAVKWGFAKLLSGLDFEVTPETGDKETRARPFASQVEAGTVAMVHASWNSDYKEELRNFPTGSYKDQVDASSRAYAKLIKGFTLTENAGPELVDGEAIDETDLVGPDGEEIDPWAGT